MTTRAQAPSPLTPPGGVTRYRDHILDQARHDPYAAKAKLAEPALCGSCGLVYRHGHWMREAAPVDAVAVACPACRRIADHLPAGFVTIAGPFARAHRAEIVGLVRNAADAEMREHPLNRIMAIDENDDELVVTTTDLHLPRRIGEALKNAYDGTLDVQQARDEFFVRIRWSR